MVVRFATVIVSQGFISMVYYSSIIPSCFSMPNNYSLSRPNTHAHPPAVLPGVPPAPAAGKNADSAQPPLPPSAPTEALQQLPSGRGCGRSTAGQPPSSAVHRAGDAEEEELLPTQPSSVERKGREREGERLLQSVPCSLIHISSFSLNHTHFLLPPVLLFSLLWLLPAVSAAGDT